MYEAFDLKSCFTADQADLVKRELSCRDNTGYPAIPDKCRPISIGDRHLCAGMDIQTRKILTDIFYRAEILYDHRIQSVFIIRHQIVV